MWSLFFGPKKDTFRATEEVRVYNLDVDIYSVKDKKGNTYQVPVVQEYTHLCHSKEFDSRTGKIHRLFGSPSDYIIPYWEAIIGEMPSFEEFIKDKVTVLTTTDLSLFVSELYSAELEEHDSKEVFLKNTVIEKRI